MSGDQDAPRPGNFDRAWNDPPLFSYTSTSAKEQQAQSTRLNKRVGFPGVGAPPLPTSAGGGISKEAGPPLAGEGLDNPKLHDAGAKPSAASLPPPPPMMSKPPPATKSTAEEVPTTSESSAKDDVAIEDVMTGLREALEASSLDDRKAKDIKKRLDAMEGKWRSGALNDKVHAGLAGISSALKAGDPESAEKTQLALVVDWPSLCGTWMVGIKHLIANVKEGKKALSEGKKEDDHADETTD